MKKLSENIITKKLTELKNWQFINNSIEKEFTLKDFNQSIAFIVKVGIESEKIDHHPEINLHSWNQVKITISTHSANGITDNDFQLAKIIDQF